MFVQRVEDVALQLADDLVHVGGGGVQALGGDQQREVRDHLPTMWTVADLSGDEFRCVGVVVELAEQQPLCQG